MGKYEDFIGRYQCPHDIVDFLVKFYKDNPEMHTGGAQGIKGNVDKNIKDSTDLYVNMNDAKTQMTGFANYEQHLSDAMMSYMDKYPDIQRQNPFGLVESFNLQHYPIGGGFKAEHHERTGELDKTIKRMLVFMTYLNDVPDGGTTFKYYDHTESAVKGKTLIWPSDFTHTHCGVVSNTQEKMIATGWFSFIWDL